MKKIILFLFGAIFFNTAHAQLTEPFDNDSQFSKAGNFVSDGGQDYFGIYDPSASGSHDFDGGSNPSGTPTYTGFTGTYLVGEDMNGDGGATPNTLTWSVPITGLTSIMFSAKIAEGASNSIDEGGAGEDHIRFTYQIDGGSITNLLAFEGADFTSNPGTTLNGRFREDADFNGVGDPAGTRLEDAGAVFTKSIAGTGTTLILRLTVNVDGSNEDIAIDDISISGVLPVELITFDAKSTSKNVSLLWKTASETNNDYFSIQRSSNGKDFQEIAVQKGAGTTFIAQNYSFIDERPENGLNYYRLMQMDYDGQFDYSDVLTIDFNNNGTISIFPNPAKETLHITNQDVWDGKVKLAVYNLNGQLLKTIQRDNPDGDILLDIQDLNTGLYQLQIISNNQVVTQRFIKN